MPSDILDAIDGALSDWTVSRDAMRWNSEAATTEARSTNSADFSLAMLPPAWPSGSLSIWPEAMTVPVALAPVGAILSVDGTLWRVARIEDSEDGMRTFSLEPPD